MRTQPSHNHDDHHYQDYDNDHHRYKDYNNGDHHNHYQENGDCHHYQDLYIIGRFCLSVTKNDHFAQRSQIMFFSGSSFFF